WLVPPNSVAVSPIQYIVDALGKQEILLRRQQSELAAIGESLESFHAGLTAMASQVQDLLSSRPAAFSSHPVSEPWLSPLGQYNGDPKSCCTFLLPYSLIFELQPSRVAYIIALLTGPAREWSLLRAVSLGGCLQVLRTSCPLADWSPAPSTPPSGPDPASLALGAVSGSPAEEFAASSLRLPATCFSPASSLSVRFCFV
uniref:DUF4939 domain-containing protein n=1 Tax=Paramormyrops kingsleyae TaxID=1676925 RepID=A0A3B3QXB2_9TELE